MLRLDRSEFTNWKFDERTFAVTEVLLRHCHGIQWISICDLLLVSIYLPVVVLPEQCQKRYVISPREALINRKAYLSCVSDHQKYRSLFIFVHVELLNISKKLLLLTFNNIILKVSIHF